LALVSNQSPIYPNIILDIAQYKSSWSLCCFWSIKRCLD